MAMVISFRKCCLDTCAGGKCVSFHRSSSIRQSLWAVHFQLRLIRRNLWLVNQAKTSSDMITSPKHALRTCKSKLRFIKRRDRTIIRAYRPNCSFFVTNIKGRVQSRIQQTVRWYSWQQWQALHHPIMNGSDIYTDIQQNLRVWDFHLLWPPILIPLFWHIMTGCNEWAWHHMAVQSASPILLLLHTSPSAQSTAVIVWGWLLSSFMEWGSPSNISCTLCTPNHL
jgi:hypothetical protein